MNQGVSSKPMKQGVSEIQRQKVLELRRSHSLREVASLTGLPLGTVKTLCHRSGAFKDNPRHRALFSLPALQPQVETLLPSVPELPAQQSVTGDQELDAVLWLRSVIETGQPTLIERALEGAKKINATPKDLEERYKRWLMNTQGNAFAAVLGSFGIADLETLAKRSLERRQRTHEALSRFGTKAQVFADTDAETFCIHRLKGLKRGGLLLDYKTDAVNQRFTAAPDYSPHTLGDCLHELAYWRDLYILRHAVEPHCGDSLPQAYARETWVFGQLALIKPRTKAEAKAVLHYLFDSDRRDWNEADAILENLIG